MANFSNGKMVGAEGFELSTYGTQNRRATRLRYAPTVASIQGFFQEEKGPFQGQGHFASL
jgi:hypothetical protein